MPKSKDTLSLALRKTRVAKRWYHRLGLLPEQIDDIANDTLQSLSQDEPIASGSGTAKAKPQSLNQNEPIASGSGTAKAKPSSQVILQAENEDVNWRHFDDFEESQSDGEDNDPAIAEIDNLLNIWRDSGHVNHAANEAIVLHEDEVQLAMAAASQDDADDIYDDTDENFGTPNAENLGQSQENVCIEDTDEDEDDDDDRQAQLLGVAGLRTEGDYIDCVYQPGLQGEDALINSFFQIYFTSEGSLAGAERYFNHFIANHDAYGERIAAGTIRGFRQNQRTTAKNLPPFLFDYVTRDPSNEKIEPFERRLSIADHPGKERLHDIGYVEMAELLKFHRRIHHNVLPVDPKGIPVHLFVDNIRESKASARSVCVFAIKFEDCALTYPVCIARPVRKKTDIDYEALLIRLIQDTQESGMRIVHVVADAPKRAELRCVKQHSSDVACDFCKGEVEDVRDEDGKLICKAWRVNDGELRTKEWMMHVLDNWEDYSEEERFGIKKKSPLFMINDFDPINDMPAEYMHSMCLGVVRNLTKLTIKIPHPTSSGNASFERISLDAFDKAMATCKVPKEFSRRIRRLDISVWKAEEYRNLILFFFPIVLSLTSMPDVGKGKSTGSKSTNFTHKTMPMSTSSRATSRLPKMVRQKGKRRTKKQKEYDSSPEMVRIANDLVRQLWNILAYLLRVYTLPREEYVSAGISISHLVLLQKTFVRLLDEIHGPWNLPYNVHQVNHLHLMRRSGPFWHTSAFYGECMFAKLQRAAKPFCKNPIKSQFETLYSSWKTGHACQRSLVICPTGGTRKKKVAHYKVEDSLFYTFHNGKYAFFQAIGFADNDVVAHKVIVGSGAIDISRYGRHSWRQVGVFTYVKVKKDEEPHRIQRGDIRGKAIIVHDLIMTIANGLLRETTTI